MDAFDSKTAQRVWQRVTASAMPQSLKPLVYTAQENAQMYQQLARQMNGNYAEKLRQIAQREKQDAAVLCGMGWLRGEKIQVVLAKERKEQQRMLTEKCCRRALQTAQQYLFRRDDPEYGGVFSEMARRQWENAQFLLALLGERI